MEVDRFKSRTQASAEAQVSRGPRQAPEEIVGRSIAFTFFGLAALACTALTPASAQDRSYPGRGEQRFLSGPSGQLPDEYVGRPRRQCFWREASGGPFGKSGFCHAAGGSAVGSQCFCRFYVGGYDPRHPNRPFTRREGTVVEARRPGAPPIVR